MAFDHDTVAEPVRPLFVQAKHLMGTFARHFVGKPRPAADRLLLEEIVHRLSRVEEQLAGMSDLPDAVQLRGAVVDRLAVVRGELAEVTAAKVKYAPQERTTFLTSRINDLFGQYRTHFAKRPRMSRRIALLRRIIAGMDNLLVEMKDPAFEKLELKARHKANEELVQNELRKIRAELDALEKEQATAPLDERIRSLAATANAEFADYRAQFAGRDAARSPQLLGEICDRLGELELQMAEIAAAHDDSMNRTNRRLLAKNLNGYEDEYRKIAAAATAAAPRRWQLADLVRHGQALREEIAAIEATAEEKQSALGHLDALLGHPILQRMGP